MTTLVVVDSHYSAIGLSAHARAKVTRDQVLSASDFISPYKLLSSIVNLEPTIVFFAWRGALLDMLSDGSNCRKKVAELHESAIGILIPDLQGLDSHGNDAESKLLNFVDFYLVTSSELNFLYSKHFPSKVPGGLYRDMPDTSGISKIKMRKDFKREKRIIWVGNSKWGQRQGKIDHKGMRLIVNPLIELLEEEVPFKVIDSSSHLLPHGVVLEEIRKSSILLQASKAEGTGLPLLEAAGLGTVVVTTNVGVAPEFLTGRLAKLIVEPDVSSFAAGIKYAFDNFSQLSALLEARFDSYINEIRSDSIQYSGPPKTKSIDSFTSSNSLLTRLKWIRRWFLARL